MAQDLLALSSVLPLQCDRDWKGDGADSWGWPGHCRPLGSHCHPFQVGPANRGLDLSVSERGSRVAVAGDSGRASGGTLTPHGACDQERSGVRFSPGVMRGLGSTTGLGSILLPWRLLCTQQWLQKGPACEPWFTAWERAQAP